MADFRFVITVPDTNATDVIFTITDHLGYSDPDGNNGQGARLGYLRAEMRDHLKSIYVRAKGQQAHSAVDTAKSDADDIPFT